MEKGVARVDDVVTGICNGPGHDSGRAFTALWKNGSGTSRADGRAIIRVGDTGITDCGHTIRAIEGSEVMSADGIRVHRVGDAVEVIEGGSGVTQTGSETFFAN